MKTKTLVLKKAYCGTKENKIVTLEKNEAPGGYYYVLINKDFSSAEVFSERIYAQDLYNDVVERLELTSVDETVFNIQN